MKLENLLGAYLGTLGILWLWRWLEIQLYGAVQERSVDTIITAFWLAFVLIAYLKGRVDGKDKEEKK